MKYIIYLTINTKSSIDNIHRIYIGVHKTKDPHIFDGYIGCGVWVNKPSSYMYPKTPFQYAVKKYGTEAFTREILYIYDTAEEAFQKEAEIVNEYFIKQSHVYNCAIGGIGGSLYEQDPRWHAKPIYQFDLEGNLQQKWNSTVDAADFYGLSVNKFTQACTDKYNLLNYYWSRENHINIKQYRNIQKKYTYLYDINGKLIAEFQSRTDCAKYLECCPQSISKAISMQQSIKNHYVSESILDIFIPKPRISLKSGCFYIYNINNSIVFQGNGKEVLKYLQIFSWKKLDSILNSNNGWYKDYYISNKLVEKIPNKKDVTKKVEVYDKVGNLLNTFDTVKKCKEFYNLTSAQITKILKGNAYHENYIFKYSK